MTKAELIAALNHFPDDAIIVTNGDDGEWCSDVNIESVGDPWCRLVSDDKPVVFVRGYGPGNINPKD